MKLNIGCGKDVRPGWVNLDSGADDLPFQDASVDEVLASHVLEHVPDRAAAMVEIARVLRRGGLLTVVAPYGLRSLFNPFHRWPFDESSMDLFTRTDPRSREPRRLFDLFAVKITSRRFPFWHLRKYLGVPLPIGRKEEVTYWMIRA